MSDQTDKIQGHCLCGAVKIELEEPNPHVEICHCDMCRRWGGAFYSALTGKSFDISGEDSITTYDSSEWAERAFCSKCGSNLWYRFKPSNSRSFLAGLFSDADRFVVEKEIFTDEKAAWCDLSGDHPRQTSAEVIAEAKEAGFNFD